MIKTLEELRAAKDEEVLECMMELKRSGKQTKEFTESFGTDYSYGSLANELTSRGYIQTWVKPQGVKEVKVKMSKNNDRINLNMTKECKEKFENFLKDKNYNFVHTTAALMTYMDAVEKKEIKVFVEV